MLKKGKWKQLFTRKRSKSRDKKKVNLTFCNLCCGKPLSDVSKLCDHHREQVSPSTQQVSSSNTSVLPQNLSNSAKAPSPGILKKSKSGSPKTAFTTLVSKTVVPLVNNTAPQSEENESVLEPALAESMASGTGKPMASPNQTGGSEMSEEIRKEPEKEAEEKNEDFMAEEVDSTNLSEHSRTENTVPIVIEPEGQKNETPNRSMTREESGLKRKISFTSTVPTQIFVIPSKEEVEAGAPEEESPVLKGAKNKTPKKNKYVNSNEESEVKKTKRQAALTVGNKVWFGTPEQTAEISNDLEGGEVHAKGEDENDDGDDEDDDDDEEEEDDDDDYEDTVEGERKAIQSEGGVEKLKEADESRLEASRNVQEAQEEVRKGDDQRDGEVACSEMNNSLMDNSIPQHSSMNPTLSEPTPLSSILPNVFLNAPLTIGNPIVDNLTYSMPVSANKEASNANLATQNVDILSASQDEEAPQNFDARSTPTLEQYTSETVENITDSIPASQNKEASNGNLAKQNANLSSASQDEESPQTVDMRSSPILEQYITETDPRMVFGSIGVEFSNEPLFYSPDFGAQVVDRNCHSGQGSITGIYNEMRNFLERTGVRSVTEPDSNVGRVIEITDSEDGQNPEEQQQQPDDPGQSPPSLEEEEEFDPQFKRKNPTEEQKELRKE